jgi:hypothetical protein
MLKRFRIWALGALAALAALLGWQYADAVTSLTWIPPTQNIDGSPLTDLSTYRVKRRASSTTGAYILLATVPAPASSYTDNATLEGVNCYVVTAVDLTGNESDPSNQACKTIDTLRPDAPSGLTAN